MTHLDDDRIVDLALGAPAGAGEDAHVATCDACGASLRSLRQTVALTRHSQDVVLVEPPPRVWDAIQAELRTAGGTATVTSLESRREMRARSSTPRSRVGLPTAWLLAAASVLGIILGVGGTTLANRVGGAPDPAQVTVASASLAPLDSPQTQGVASLVDSGGGLRLDLPAMELDAGEGYLEVWLINRDLTRMISIGVIPSDTGEIVLPVSQRLIDEGYVIVDISREAFDDKPQHSGQTLARGTLRS